MINTPLSEQLKIVLFGLRNSGKSSLMNNIFEKEISIISDKPGTTTDPVTRSIELSGLGPVAITDTAGFDDAGDLGKLRIKKSHERFKDANIIVFVTRGDEELTDKEIEFLKSINTSTNLIVVVTFGDKNLSNTKIIKLNDYKTVIVDNINKKGINKLKEKLIELKNDLAPEITPVEGLVNENELVVLVTPIDLAAPKGRLILPQVETIRDLLDKDCAVLILKERELKYFYDSLKIKPKLVITDSQVFSKVAADIPDDQMLTSFSILFARKKGDLSYFIEGIKKLKETPDNAKILILEACNHHRQADDIGTVKIPRLFKQLVKSTATIEFAREIPEHDKLKEYYLVINCGGCMVTRTKMMNRLNIFKEYNIHVINYGLFLAWVNGLLPRALEPFPYEYGLYK